jgi:predicted DNA-binding WGR domain protein
MTYLEFVGEDVSRGVAESSKFWQVTQDGMKLTIVFGKIGTNGQTTEKSFSSPEEATKEMEKLIKSKLKKGYVEKAR